jgi:hypothetical protein
MAAGSGLATALAAVKAHAMAATIIGAVIVGGGAATAAVVTGAVQVPGISAHDTGSNTGSNTGSTSAATSRAQACADNGDATRLASLYAPMFGGSASAARQEICTLFATGSGGHAFGLGEVQLILETTAAIERNGTGCLPPTATATGSTAHGQPTQTGKPADPGHSGSAGTPAAGHPSAAILTASTSETLTDIGLILKADADGTPLAQLAHDCGATPATGNPGGGGTDHGQPTTTPGARPSETPGGARPTGTPGQGH